MFKSWNEKGRVTSSRIPFVQKIRIEWIHFLNSRWGFPDYASKVQDVVVLSPFLTMKMQIQAKASVSKRLNGFHKTNHSKK